MKVLHIAAELAPIAKVGGLADVVLGLSNALSDQGHEASILIPKYDCIDWEGVDNLTCVVEDLPCLGSNISVWRGMVRGLTTYFIDTDHPAQYFSRRTFYGCEDDTARFLYFCRAAIEFLKATDQSFDVWHVHDWQGAAVCPLYHDLFDGFADTRLVFTIHNIEYQGKCTPDDLNEVGFDGPSYLALDKLGDNYEPHRINLMKGGIVYSNAVTTVSPSYAQEVLSPEGGRGLEATLRQYQHKFRGILNGIDYNYWDPKTDPFLFKGYHLNGTPEHKDLFETKAFNKQRLRELLKLEDCDRPIVAAITRLVPQKGVHLLQHALKRTLELEGQFILLGSSPVPEIQAEFETLRDATEDNPHIAMCLQHSEQLAHQIFAGADMLIVPSLFEPCGLTQLIALHYGTIPIVRETGGLADTVFDVDYSHRPMEEVNGFTFKDADYGGVNWALDRGIHCFRHEPQTWKDLVCNGMRTDCSWAKPAKDYAALYEGSSGA